MRHLLALPIFLYILLPAVSNAEIVIPDWDSAEIEGTDISMIDFGTGSGQENNFVVFACSTSTDGSNTFNTPVLANPSQAIVSPIDIGNCQDENACMTGIWSIDTNNPDDTEITCSWDDPRTVATGIGVRFSGVDFSDPIVDYACNTGFGRFRTAPSVIAEDNSQAIFIFTTGRFLDEDGIFAVNQDEVSVEEITGIGLSRSAVSDTEELGMSLDSFPLDAGPTGERTSISGTDESVWRACTIVLRAQRAEIIKPIPTLSEWGLMVLAGIFGVLGLIALKRRRATA